MNRPIIQIYDAAMGEEIIREMNDDEYKYWLESKPVREAEQVTAIRAERNTLLAESDWTQAKDIPDSISTPWATYRQALRDIPQQAGFPASITWPEKP